jgi:uncharacterized protein YbjT (DUF2867 family)
VRAIVFGATGMVGKGVLLECLEDTRVDSLLAVGRGSTGIVHPKMQEILQGDFFDLAPIQSRFAGYDACFFSVGVSALGLSEEKYHRLTYDLTLAAARSIVEVSPNLTFCYVSGAGTDSTERGRTMWARVKGKTENALLALPFKAAYMFRPGFIVPLKGVRSKTPLYQTFYSILGPLLPVLRRAFPRHVTTTVIVGRAFIEVVTKGYPRRVLEMEDINALGNNDLVIDD